MKMERLCGGALKIWMSEQELLRWGLRFEQLSAHDRATGAAVRRLLQVARGRAALPEAGSITVEAVPFEGGCLWLFTPGHRVYCRMPPAQVFALKTADDLLQLGGWLSTVSRVPTASLFGWGEEYRAVVYPGGGAWRDFCRRLTEFADPLDEASAAFVEEHGTAIAVGDAFNRLRAAFEREQSGRVR